MGLMPQREAEAASEWRRSGLLPAATSRVDAVSGPMPKPSTRSEANAPSHGPVQSFAFDSLPIGSRCHSQSRFSLILCVCTTTTLIRMTVFIDLGRFAGRGWPGRTRGSRPRSCPLTKECLQMGRNTKQGRRSGDQGNRNLTRRPDHSSLSVRPRNTWVKMSVSRMDWGSPWNATRPLSST